jgi:hypothetical protein
VGSGQAADSTNAAYITSAGYSWAVSNGNAINGYQGGTTLPNSSTIHFFVCSGGSGTGSFASTSLTPTLPTGYSTYYRRIFSLLTGSGGSPLNMTVFEAEGGSYYAYFATDIQNVSSGSLTTTPSNITVSVPNGLRAQWIGQVFNSSSTGLALFMSPDEQQITASGNQFDVAAGGGTTNSVKMALRLACLPCRSAPFMLRKCFAVACFSTARQ